MEGKVPILTGIVELLNLRLSASAHGYNRRILTEGSELTVGFPPILIFPPPVALEDGTRQAWTFVEARPL